MRPIGVTLVCLYQLLRGVMWARLWTFHCPLYRADNQFVARASKAMPRNAGWPTSATRPASLSSYLLSCTRSRAMAFCAGETGASVDDLSFCPGTCADSSRRHPCQLVCPRF